MSHNQKIKLRYNDTSQAYNTQQNKFTEILEKSVKDFTKWPAKKQIFAVGAVGAMFFTVLPILSAALPFALIGVTTALTLYFAVKTVFYTVQGIKWSAGKIVEGTKYSAKKVEEGAEYSIKQLKEGADYLGQKTKDGFNDTVDSLKRGTGEVLHNTASRLYNVAGETNYLEKIKEFTTEQKNQSQQIRGELKEIFDNKENSANLVGNILSGIASKINLKIEEEKKIGWIEHTDKWKEQKKFINKLDAGKLQCLLTQRSLPKDSYFIDSIFSEHYKQIQDVMKIHNLEVYRQNDLYSTIGKSNIFVEGKSSRRTSSSSLNIKKPETSNSTKAQAQYSEQSEVALSGKVSQIVNVQEPIYATIHKQATKPSPVATPRVPASREETSFVSMYDSRLAEFDRSLERLGIRGYTSTPESKKPVSNLINEFEVMNSSDSLRAPSDQTISPTTSARSSFSFYDSGNGSKKGSFSSSKSDFNINKQRDLMIKELKERRNSFPTSKIDVQTITKHQHTQKVS